jgi:NAD dependent epimerase/dehydratase family enzyme
MTAPNPVTNAEVTKVIARVLNKPLWLPNVPAFGLKLALGEMSALVLDSAKVSAAKIQSEGFSFNFPEINEAVKNIYSE